MNAGGRGGMDDREADAGVESKTTGDRPNVLREPFDVAAADVAVRFVPKKGKRCSMFSTPALGTPPKLAWGKNCGRLGATLNRILRLRPSRERGSTVWRARRFCDTMRRGRVRGD